MKTSWLRGTLLGVSLALLLAGGVALAQALTLTVDQDCFECSPGDAIDPGQIVVVTADDYSKADLCGEIRIDGELFMPSGECSVPPHEGPCEVLLAVTCSDMQLHMLNGCVEEGDAAAVWQEAGPSFTPVEYGDWVVKAWQESNGQPVGPARFVGFTFAQTCAAQEVEFVPEPGTIALLGSGLAGLAGYATLRWRARR